MKKQYERPTLVTRGDIREVTAGSLSGPGLDASFPYLGPPAS